MASALCALLDTLYLSYSLCLAGAFPSLGGEGSSQLPQAEAAEPGLGCRLAGSLISSVLPLCDLGGVLSPLWSHRGFLQWAGRVFSHHKAWYSPGLGQWEQLGLRRV